jgi:putative ABC transport system permease protein
MVMQKLASNRWMVACLLAGTVVAVAMVSSIPIYTEGVLQRMLTRDLEGLQQETGIFPGRFLIKVDGYALYDRDRWPGVYKGLLRELKPEMFRAFGVSVITHTIRYGWDYFTMLPEVQRSEDPKKRYINVEALSGFEDHIEITHGRIFSPRMGSEGLIEVMATAEALQRYDLRLGETYVAEDLTSYIPHGYRFQIVGVFTNSNDRDPYWFDHISGYNQSFLMDFSLFRDLFMDQPFPLPASCRWFFAFDYHEIVVDNLRRILRGYDGLKRWTKSITASQLDVPAMPIIEGYELRERQLKLTLWVLEMPILLMLVFYLFMVSQLVVETEKSEIAVLKSRGARSGQVFLSYTVEGGILGGTALVLGPPLGLLTCQFLGSTTGFLEFVQRTALPVSLDLQAYGYALAAAALAMVTMLVPAFLSSRTTIVVHKREKARANRPALWRRIFLDVILVGVAVYGLYRYQIRQRDLAATGAEALELSIDPLLFLISTLFVLGAGLVVLRFFPLLIRFIYRSGRRLWSPVLYASFVQVGRSGGKNQFLMLFLILTLSTGIYSANAARTLNSNIEERIRYEIGADLSLRSHWESNEPPESWDDGGFGEEESLLVLSSRRDPVLYQEPPFLPYRELEGVRGATKVLINKDAVAQTPSGDWVRRLLFMAVVPHEFGDVAWFRRDLLPHHWYGYLNLMATNPKAALLSRSLAEDHGVKVGDSLFVNWAEQDYLEVVVYGFVDFWPTYNPFSQGEQKSRSHLVVANLPYVHSKMAMEPYEVWLNRAPGATSAQIYSDILAKGIEVERLDDAAQEIITAKNDPLLQGTNGSLTLGFLVTMSISAVGFLIFWIISIRERVLQFGVFRAMGLSTREIIGMLLFEQTLISGFAIFAGIVVGGLTSDLFVPLLQMVYSAQQQVPPFQVVASAQDYARLYLIVALMLVSVMTVLAWSISRIKVHQAIKLGEE